MTQWMGTNRFRCSLHLTSIISNSLLSSITCYGLFLESVILTTQPKIGHVDPMLFAVFGFTAGLLNCLLPKFISLFSVSVFMSSSPLWMASSFATCFLSHSSPLHTRVLKCTLHTADWDACFCPVRTFLPQQGILIDRWTSPCLPQTYCTVHCSRQLLI